MAKTLTFTFEGKDYTLEYTREAVKTMERAGFVADDLAQKPMLMFPQLFSYAFWAHHKYLNGNEIQKIFDRIPNRRELLARLVEMYREPYEEFMNDPEPEDGEGNVTWTANF